MLFLSNFCRLRKSEELTAQWYSIGRPTQRSGFVSRHRTFSVYRNSTQNQRKISVTLSIMKISISKTTIHYVTRGQKSATSEKTSGYCEKTHHFQFTKNWFCIISTANRISMAPIFQKSQFGWRFVPNFVDKILRKSAPFWRNFVAQTFHFQIIVNIQSDGSQT